MSKHLSASFWKRTLVALALSALALAGSTLAQSQGTKTCMHEGKTYQPGEKATINGQAMQCDGNTGTWVPAKV